MKPVAFFAILFAILITKHEVNGEKNDPDSSYIPTFVDNDFTDYQEDPSPKANGLLDKASTSLENLEPTNRRNKTSNPEKSKPLLKRGSSHPDKASTLVESTLKRIKKSNIGKAKDLLIITEVEVLKKYLKLLRKDGIESILTNIPELDPKIEKISPKTKREARLLDITAQTSSEEGIESTFRRNGKLNSKEERAAKKQVAAEKRENDIKVKEIMNFMENNYMTTNYIYDEVQRIIRQGHVKDKFRNLIEYLEQNDKLKESVLQCYYERRKIDKPRRDVYKNRHTNNLIINVLKDPYNDGYIN